MASSELGPLKYKKSTSSEVPPGFPLKIYKCRNWSNPYHKEIITKRQIHFAHAIKFPDKFDCQFPIEYDLTYETVSDSFRGEIIKVIRKEGITPNQFNIERRLKKLYEDNFGSDEKKEERKKEYRELLSNNTYVFSASKSNDNPQLWRDYGDDLKGFCVEINMEEVVKLVPSRLLMGGEVRYINDPNFKLKHNFLSGDDSNLRSDLFEEILMDNFLFKFNDYEFENEFRLLIQDWTEHLKKMPHYKDKIPPFSDKLDLPISAYSGIIFGQDINPLDIDEIKKAVSEQGLNVTYKMAFRNGDQIEVRNM